jgi:hypothetical protein
MPLGAMAAALDHWWSLHWELWGTTRAVSHTVTFGNFWEPLMGTLGNVWAETLGNLEWEPKGTLGNLLWKLK